MATFDLYSTVIDTKRKEAVEIVGYIANSFENIYVCQADDGTNYIVRAQDNILIPYDKSWFDKDENKPETNGLKVKYDVFKVEDGSKVFGCFVLRPDKDEAAIAALRAYAKATPNKELAADINNWMDSLTTPHLCPVCGTMALTSVDGNTSGTPQNGELFRCNKCAAELYALTLLQHGEPTLGFYDYDAYHTLVR